MQCKQTGNFLNESGRFARVVILKKKTRNCGKNRRNHIPDPESGVIKQVCREVDGGHLAFMQMKDLSNHNKSYFIWFLMIFLKTR